MILQVINLKQVGLFAFNKDKDSVNNVLINNNNNNNNNMQSNIHNRNINKS